MQSLLNALSVIGSLSLLAFGLAVICITIRRYGAEVMRALRGE